MELVPVKLLDREDVPTKEAIVDLMKSEKRSLSIWLTMGSGENIILHPEASSLCTNSTSSPVLSAGSNRSPLIGRRLSLKLMFVVGM